MADETVFHLRPRKAGSSPIDAPPSAPRRKVLLGLRPFSPDPEGVTTTIGLRSEFVITNGPLASGRYRR